jgi:flagellar motor component MotA
MINIAEDIVKNHDMDEIIEFLYDGLKSANKTLEDSVNKQNLMELGAIAPALAQYAAVLKIIKNLNDLRKVARQ